MLFDLASDLSNKVTDLPEYETSVLTGILDRMEQEKDYIFQRLNQIFNEVYDADTIIFLARQGVAIGHGLIPMFKERGISIPTISILSTSSVTRDQDTNMKATFLESQKETIQNEILCTNIVGRKFFIDDMLYNGTTEARLKDLTNQLDPMSSYKFTTMYSRSATGHMQSPWDLRTESVNMLPTDELFISSSEYLNLQQAKLFETIDDKDVNIIIPVHNPHIHSQTIARSIAEKFSEIGILAAKR